MKRFVPLFFVLCIVATGCTRSSNEVWEDTRTAGHYMGRSFRSLGGKHGDSRQVKTQAEFTATTTDDYIPLEDENLYRQLSLGDVEALNRINIDTAIPLSIENPGAPTSDIPGINGFIDAHSDSQLGAVFRRLHFPYNSNLIKGHENLDIIKGIASYMKADSSVYIFVEGHCDERGAASYNLALGSRRSHAVRNLMVKEGIDSNRIFTISYGKERPLVSIDSENGWSQNRRAQFRVYRR